jgi:hypothetical protein
VISRAEILQMEGCVLTLTENDPPVSLLRESFRAAKRARSGGAAPAPRRLVLADVRAWDAQRRAFGGGPQAVVLQGDRIVAVSTAVDAVVAAARADGSALVHCGGMFLLPGLCDAHVHCTAITADLARLMSYPGAAGLGGRLAWVTGWAAWWAAGSAAWWVAGLRA